MDLQRNEGVRVYPLEPQDQIEPWPDRQIGQMVEAKLKELLGPRTLVASKVNGEKALWISFDIEGDQYWLITDPKRLERQLGGNWLEVSATGMLLGTDRRDPDQPAGEPSARQSGPFDREPIARGAPAAPA